MSALEPVTVPRRFSQSLLAKDDNCPRAAYLAAKHRGDERGSHAMDRGTLFHLFAERAMVELIRAGERQFAPEDPAQAASMTAAMVDELARSSTGLVLPRREVDDVREMAYHWAVGYDVDPETVAGLERLFVLDLECGVTVSGRLDVVALPSAELGQVDDYKSAFAMPSQDDYEGDVQAWIYAVLLMFGVPVDFEQCITCSGAGVVYEQHGFATEELGCPECEGRGYVELRGEPMGRHLQGVLTREVYPRLKLRDDGGLHRRELLLSRTAIADYRADLERQAVVLMQRFESWEFPARSGSWCSECPAQQECPLPAELRDHAGEINSREQAEESYAKTLLQKARLAALEEEVKRWARAHGPIRVGDLEFSWEPTEGRALAKKGRSSDWDGLQAAVVEAAEFGVPFDLSKWVLPTTGSRFVKRKVTGDRS